MGAKHSSMGESVSRWRRSEKPNDVVEKFHLPRANVDRSDVLKVFNTYLHLEKNSREHSTYRYAILKSEGRLIVRRGQPFLISLDCSRGYQEGVDAISLFFYLKGVNKPDHSTQTMIFLPVAPPPGGEQPQKWRARLVRSPPDTPPKPPGHTFITIEVTSSPSSHIGEWLLQVDTSLLNNKIAALNFKQPAPIGILFNPWNKEDSVFMQDEALRQEYVLKDEGVLFIGTTEEIDKLPWTFGQFSPGMLECCFLAVSNGGLPAHERNDPIKIVRMFSALANANDDDGLLLGRWDGEYNDGIAPTAWVGSAKIVQQYIKQQKPVKYGQCWVFSGVLTAMARALGIPSRPVTCFNSGHDSNLTLTIDNFVTITGEEKETDDMTWNYHVWNEMWMKRPDLEPKYDGWQAIDGTPQEKSLGVYRLGPCSVVAVKGGEIHRPFDVPFVMGEVNADYVMWLNRGDDKPIKSLEWDKSYVGKFISTKKAGSYDREDVTDTYKAKEDTREERAIINWAWKELGDVFPRFEKNNEKAGIDFELDAPKNVTIGEDIRIRLVIINNSTKNQLTVNAALILDSVSYTDTKLGRIKQEKYQKVVGKNEHFDLVVPYHEYTGHIKEQGYMRASVLASAPEFDYDEFLKNTFRAKPPPIGFSVSGSHIVGQELFVTTQITNPLSGALSKAYMLLSGSGIGEGQKKLFNKGAQPKETLSHTFTVVPQMSGKLSLNAKFWAPELHFSEGYHIVSIQ